MTNPITPQIGDNIYLGSFLANINAFGTISDLDTPDMTSFTIEGFGSNATLNVAALMGPQGPTGDNAPLGKLQRQIFSSSADLPNNLTNDPVDIGKYWIVRDYDPAGNVTGSSWYIWYGDHYEQFQMGTAGPAGPVPIISPHVTLLDPDGTANSNVAKTGNDFNPSLTFNLKVPRGPAGPAGPIRDAADYDDGVAPVAKDVITWNGTKYAPAALAPKIPRFYTVPESNFTAQPLAIGNHIQVASFTLPPQAYDCVPYVTGHLRVTGVDFDTDPLIVGTEVRLGSPTAGTLVGRGFGNISTYTHIVPHASTGTATTDAITPENRRGVIPAGTTGAAATLYVSLFNDGASGIYHFETRGAQLSILAVPL